MAMSAEYRSKFATSNGVVSKWVKKSWVGCKNPNKQNKQITNAGMRPLLGVYGIWSGGGGSLLCHTRCEMESKPL